MTNIQYNSPTFDFFVIYKFLGDITTTWINTSAEILDWLEYTIGEIVTFVLNLLNLIPGINIPGTELIGSIVNAIFPQSFNVMGFILGSSFTLFLNIVIFTVVLRWVLDFLPL